MKKTIESYEKICNKVIQEFCKKQELKFDYWIADEIGNIAAFGDYFFNMNEIIFDLKSNQPKGLIMQWQDDMVEYFDTRDLTEPNPINYNSYAMGLRYGEIRKPHSFCETPEEKCTIY